jgi:transposase
MEACGGAHYWARQFIAMGHIVKLISPQFVKPYVKSNKNDHNDAVAICEAATRPSMRFVPVKSIQQQDIQLLHKVRSKLIKDKVALGNQMRGLLMEYGIIMPQGDTSLRKTLVDLCYINSNSDLTSHAHLIFKELYEEFVKLERQIDMYTRRLSLIAKHDEQCQALMSIPGIKEITATVLISSVGDFNSFKNSRDLSAWVGPVPKHKASGQKKILLRISKRGDSYLRRLLVHGARAVVSQVKDKADRISIWIRGCLSRIGFNKTVVALANKNTRIAWAIIAKGQAYETNYAHVY